MREARRERLLRGLGGVGRAVAGGAGATAALATASVALTVVFSGKWQAAWCPGDSSTSGGSTCLQMSCAFQQRVWNRQAGGGSSGLGTSPCSRIRLRSPRSLGSGIGTADSSALV